MDSNGGRDWVCTGVVMCLVTHQIVNVAGTDIKRLLRVAVDLNWFIMRTR